MGLNRRDIMRSLAGIVGSASATNAVAGLKRRSQAGKREYVPGQVDCLLSFPRGNGDINKHNAVQQSHQSFSNVPAISPIGLTEQWRTRISEPSIVSFTLRPGSPRTEPAYLVGTNLNDAQNQSIIYALERSNGSVRWSETTPGQPTVSIGSNSRVYYTTNGFLKNSSRVVALDQSNGTELWSHSSEIPQSAFQTIPRYIPPNSTLYIITQGMKVIALNDGTGTVKWSSQPRAGLQPLAPTFNQASTTVFIAGFEVSQTSRKGHIRAVDLTKQGAEEWLKKRPYPASGTPVTDGDLVFQAFSSQQNDTSSNVDTELVAFNATDGSVEWSNERTDGLLYSFILDNQSSIYVSASRNTSSGSEGVMSKFEKSSGRLIWEYDTGGQILGLKRDNNYVYVATRPGEVIKIIDDSSSPNYGEAAWTQSVNAGIRDAGLEKAGDVLYTGTITEPGTIYAIDVADGSIISSQQVFSGYLSPIIAGDGAVWTAGAGQAANSSTIENEPSYAYKLVGQADGNVPPSPLFTVTPSSPATGESATFDASGSSDPDGAIQTYEWDLDNDGSYEETGKTVTHTFTTTGDRTVTLRVTDDSGATATTEQTVSVGGGGSTLPPNLQRFDTNNKTGIQTDEIVDAIVAYNSGTQIGGQPVTRGDVVDLIVAYNN